MHSQLLAFRKYLLGNRFTLIEHGCDDLGLPSTLESICTELEDCKSSLSGLVSFFNGQRFPKQRADQISAMPMYACLTSGILLFDQLSGNLTKVYGACHTRSEIEWATVATTLHSLSESLQWQSQAWKFQLKLCQSPNLKYVEVILKFRANTNHNAGFQAAPSHWKSSLTDLWAKE